MDEQVFERWKESRRRRKRPAGMPVSTTILALFSLGVVTASTFGVGLALAPARVIETLQGTAIRERELFDADEDMKDFPIHVVEVRLPNGETTGVTLPKGETVRPDAAMKIDHLRKTFGPAKIEWHQFAGYVEPSS